MTSPLNFYMLTKRQQAILKDYEVRHLIGCGSFAKVYDVEEIETGTRYAVKVIAKGPSAEMEVNVISCLDHPSLLNLHEVLSDDDCYYIVTEFISNGTLLQHLGHRRNFTEDEARCVFSDILDGVSCLHSKYQVAHLDLKLENVMIDSLSHARIIDFGLARPFKLFRNTRLKCGSPPYCSPEMLSGQSVTEQTDVWSLGVLLYALVVGNYPFSASDDCLMTSRILLEDCTFPLSVSNEFKDLIQRMLQKDPTNRITLANIALHPWITRGVATCAPVTGAFSFPRLPVLVRPALDLLKFPVPTHRIASHLVASAKQVMLPAKSRSRVTVLRVS
jgi:serine/threonine protein kinase